MLTVLLAAALAVMPADFSTARLSWGSDLHAKRLNAAVGLYGQNAVFVLPSGQRITGSSAIKSLFAGVMRDYTSTISFTSLSSTTCGEWGYDSGTYVETLAVSKTDQTMRSHGSYFTLYRHEPGGKWLIAEQVWTGVVSAPSPKH